MQEQRENKAAKYKPWVWILSIAIPIVVALLFLVRIPNVAPLRFLPPIYAAINATTALVLLFAFIAIKRKNVQLHEGLMKTAIGLSVVSW